LLLTRVRRDQALNKSEFHGRLRDFWLHSSDDGTVGPRAAYGRIPWVYVRDGFRVFVLNADTKREAVGRYLELVKQHSDDLRWEITASQQDKMTAVLYGPERHRLKPFYLYAAGIASAPKRSRRPRSSS
jgi:hypothetical protein